MDKYPSIEDDDFQFKIAKRLEFRNLHNVDGLYPHQEFVRRFMSPYTPYDSLIMYHSLGSGKSIACIAVAVDHYLHDGKRCIIVTKGPTGTENFAKQIQMYHEMSSRNEEWDMSFFSFRRYIEMSNQVKNLLDEDVIKAFSNSIIVLDEVHNVRYLRKETEKSVYGSIIRLLRLCSNLKIIIATATPMTDSPEQIQSLLGICNYSRNSEHKWSMNGIISYNSTILHKPDSYEIGTEDFISGIRVYPSYMTSHQEIAYRKENGVQPPDDIYRKLTHISLFCFEDGVYGREIQQTKMTRTKTNVLITSMSTKQTKEIKYYKYSILPQYAHMLTGNNLRKSSCKYSKVIEDLTMNTRGNTFIFLEEVKGSGLLLLASVLEQHGYELYIGQDLDKIPKRKRYTMCVGSSDICPNNTDRLDGFNSNINKDGEYVEVLLGSKVIGESITLKNVRQFYCITPHWNDSTVDQAIGRAVRNGSHSVLEENQRNVNIYIHAAIFPEDPQSSVDIKKLAKCKEKERHIQAVAETMINFAVDRYIDDPELPVTHVHNFAAAYLHNHMDNLVYTINNFFNRYPLGNSVSIVLVSKVLDIYPVICQEAICRIISSNTAMTYKDEQEEIKYYFLRAYGDNVFTVEDISLPFVSMPEIEVVQTQYSLGNRVSEYTLSKNAGYSDNSDTLCLSRCPSKSCQSESVSAYTSIDFDKHDNIINVFRYMPVKQKAAFIEECILTNKQETLKAWHLDTLYAYISINNHSQLYSLGNSETEYTNEEPHKNLSKKCIFHLLLYRDLDSSYTSSNPVPKKPMGKTRMLVQNSVSEYTLSKNASYSDTLYPSKSRSVSFWVTVTDTTVEQRVLDEYRILAQEMINYYDEHFPIYGIISTIDGDMRLRLRDAEDVTKSSKDNRYVRRGKNMRSIKKEYLFQILNFLYSDETASEYIEDDSNLSINEIAKRIDNALVKKDLYIVV